jgi:hypothetical protein
MTHDTATYPFVESTPDRKPVSHSRAILSRLARSENFWVPMPHLADYTEQRCKSRCYVVHSRIAELRDKGHDIENMVMISEGVKHSFYRLKSATGDAQA